jgi:hypothetical protein
VLNPDVEAVNMYAYFTEPVNPAPCMSMYDMEFKFPEYLLDALFETTNQSLVNYHKMLPEPHSDNEDDQP